MNFILGLASGFVIGLLFLLLKIANKAWFQWSDQTFGLVQFWVILAIIVALIIAKIVY